MTQGGAGPAAESRSNRRSDWAKPTLTVYRDVDEFPATYLLLELEHEVALAGDLRLVLGASAGYLSGDSSAYARLDPAGQEVGMYRALHDGSVSVALRIPLGAVELEPSARLAFPLSADAAEEGLTPSGHVEPVLVYGLTASWSL